MRLTCLAATLAAAALLSTPAQADENLFGYVRGAEVIPAGGWEFYSITTLRNDKGRGHYRAWDQSFELEYGVSDRFNLAGALRFLDVDTSGLSIDGYLPGGEDIGPRAAAIEIEGKYNFLRPAADVIGLSLNWGVDYGWLDPHSGEDKDTLSAETTLLLQKYFRDGEIVWVGNAGLEATYADRAAIDDLPDGFDWPTDPEMELEVKLGTGVTWRFAPNWYVGAEALYETEFETEVGQERWSLFAGPSLHYGGRAFWATLTWLPQIEGGGEQYADQRDRDLHLIEKTETETRLKLGFNF